MTTTSTSPTYQICRKCEMRPYVHVREERDGVRRRWCPDGSGNWYTPHARRVCAGQTFREGEIQILESLFDAVLSGRDMSSLVRHSEFTKTRKKILRMRGSIEKIKQERAEFAMHSQGAHKHDLVRPADIPEA